MPGSMIMVALLPTMMPTFGTPGTDSLGMAYTWGETLTVTPSFTTGHSLSPFGERVVLKTCAVAVVTSVTSNVNTASFNICCMAIPPSCNDALSGLL